MHGTTAITTIASFNGTNGLNPNAAVTLDSSGNIFGTTVLGGASNFGTVFEIVHGTTAITTVASFNGFNGMTIRGGVTLDASGNLFGTATNGGASGLGTLFEIVQGSTIITPIASFNNANGTNPQAAPTFDANGNLFGTTAGGGTGSTGNGTVFEVFRGTTAITTIAVFNGANGAFPDAGVTLDASGNIFGTTEFGNAIAGTVFEVVHGTTAITTISTFTSSSPNGANPQAGLTLDASGNLYGTTSSGGSGASGTIFKLTNAPQLSFIGQPAYAAAGDILNPATGIQVSVLTSWGNVAIGDTSHVTLTLSSGVFSTGSNAVTVSAVNGIATFNNLSIRSAGSIRSPPPMAHSPPSPTPSTSFSSIRSPAFCRPPAAPSPIQTS